MISLQINVTTTSHLRGGKTDRVCNIDRPNCVQVQGPNKNYPRGTRLREVTNCCVTFHHKTPR